jgi:hypothetical protein
MESYALAFPLLFIFHDLEEIVGMRVFLDRNKDTLQRRFPKIYDILKDTTNEGFALAVWEEFVVFALIALAAMWIDNKLVWNIWLGGFLGLTFHYAVHIGQALVLRKYVPAVATSVVCLPISIYILKQCFIVLDGDVATNVWQIALGVVIVAVNFLVAHKITKIRLAD